jgi:hypothetical protein
MTVAHVVLACIVLAVVTHVRCVAVTARPGCRAGRYVGRHHTAQATLHMDLTAVAVEICARVALAAHSTVAGLALTAHGNLPQTHTQYRQKNRSASVALRS